MPEKARSKTIDFLRWCGICLLLTLFILAAFKFEFRVIESRNYPALEAHKLFVIVSASLFVFISLVYVIGRRLAGKSNVASLTLSDGLPVPFFIKPLLGILTAVLVTNLFAFPFFMRLNGENDKSDAQIYTVQITDRFSVTNSIYQNKRRGHNYYVSFASWKTEGEIETIAIPAEIYQKIDIHKPATLHIKSGTFGYEWVQDSSQ